MNIKCAMLLQGRVLSHNNSLMPLSRLCTASSLRLPIGWYQTSYWFHSCLLSSTVLT